MVALVVALACVMALMAVLITGLLRSHADILKALHDLGAGVGDPGERAGAGSHHAASPQAVPLTLGPTLPPGRDATSAPAIAGITPNGDARAVTPAGSAERTLLAFLSSGCTSCASFWEVVRQPDNHDLPPGTRLVVITKGPDREVPAEVQALAGSNQLVVMSSEAWTDYEVPGSPFFVLIDGPTGRRIGEGVASGFAQVAELVHRAAIDATGPSGGTGTGPAAVGLDGPERESDNDLALIRAGILPGDPSLYPTSLDDLYGPPDARLRSVRGLVGKG